MSEINNNKALVPEKKEGTLRLVSNNILNQSIVNSPERLEGLIEAYKCYDADIFSLQEVDKVWREEYHLSDVMISLGYTPATGHEEYATPVFYKTGKFNCIDSGRLPFDLTETPEKEGRSFHWACLEEKASGKRIIVTGCHFISSGGKATNDEQKWHRELHRQTCARQLPVLLKGFCEKYGAVGISAADFNSNCTSVSYAILSKELNSARELAPVKVNMDYMTSCWIKRAPYREPLSAIDHVFYTDGVTPVRYEVFIEPFSYAYTDHVPVFFDFILD